MDDLDVADSFLILQDGSFEGEPGNELGAGGRAETGPSGLPSSRCMPDEDTKGAFDSDDDSLFSAISSQQERASPPLPHGLGTATRDAGPGREYLLTQAEHDGDQEEDVDEDDGDNYDQSFVDDGGVAEAVSTQQHSHYLRSLLSPGSPARHARSIPRPRQAADVYSQDPSSDDSYELGSFVVADTDSEEDDGDQGRRRQHSRVLNRDEFLYSSSSDDEEQQKNSPGN